MDHYDVIVIGAGTNGLATAGLLAKSGRKVIVLEQRDRCGGLAVGESLGDNAVAPGPLHDTSGIRHHLLSPLALSRHGLELRSGAPSVFGPNGGARGLLLHNDPAKAAEELREVSPADVERYAAFRAFIDSVRDAVNGILDDMPFDITALAGRDLMRALRKGAGLRRLGTRTMLELLRVGPMAVADWLDEYFESDLLKTILAGPAVYGSFLGPRSPGSATNLLVYECRKGPLVQGGAPAFVSALESAVRAQGAEIRTGARVDRIDVDAGSVRGVTLDGGESIEARVVASSCDPITTFLRFLAGSEITETFAHRIRKYRCAGVSAKVDLVLRSSVRFTGRDGESIEIVRTGSRLDDIERAFDPLKYGTLTDRPVLDIQVPGEGQGVLSVLMNFVPYELKEEWSDAHRGRIGNAVIDTLASVAPDIRETIVHAEVTTPREIESRYGVHGGHILHGDHQLDQLFSRPSPECAEYASPIGGLFLVGSGAHPGGGLTCAPGVLSARAILRR